jgi:hypothetical protein
MAKEIIWSPQSEATFYKVLEYLQDSWTEKEVDNFLTATEIMPIR